MPPRACLLGLPPAPPPWARSNVFAARTYASVGAYPDGCPNVMPNGVYRFLVVAGHEHEVVLTNSLPSRMELRFFSASAAEAVLLRLFVEDPMALDVFAGGAGRVNASTGLRPTLLDPSGTNQVRDLCALGGGWRTALGTVRLQLCAIVFEGRCECCARQHTLVQSGVLAEGRTHVLVCSVVLQLAWLQQGNPFITPRVPRAVFPPHVQLDPQARRLWLTLRGPTSTYTIAATPVVQLTIRLTVTIEEFFGETLVQNIALLLGVRAPCGLGLVWPVFSAPLHPCTPAPLHPCTPAPLHPCTPAPLHPCTPAFLHTPHPFTPRTPCPHAPAPTRAPQIVLAWSLPPLPPPPPTPVPSRPVPALPTRPQTPPNPWATDPGQPREDCQRACG
jgi:hypothetical protein